MTEFLGSSGMVGPRKTTKTSLRVLGVSVGILRFLSPGSTSLLLYRFRVGEVFQSSLIVSFLYDRGELFRLVTFNQNVPLETLP